MSEYLKQGQPKEDGYLKANQGWTELRAPESTVVVDWQMPYDATVKVGADTQAVYIEIRPPGSISPTT